MRLLSALLVATALAAAPAAHAVEGQVSGTPAVPDATNAVLPIERVFASPSLNGPVPRGVKLSPDGRYLTMLRNRADDRERWDLWSYDRTTGQWAMLVDSKKFESGKDLSEASKMQRERMRLGDVKGIVSYAWAADGKGILVPIDGDLYLGNYIHGSRSSRFGAVG